MTTDNHWPLRFTTEKQGEKRLITVETMLAPNWPCECFGVELRPDGGAEVYYESHGNAEFSAGEWKEFLELCQGKTGEDA